MPKPPDKPCPACGNKFQPRNWARHVKACNRTLRKKFKGDRVAYREWLRGKAEYRAAKSDGISLTSLDASFRCGR